MAKKRAEEPAAPAPSLAVALLGKADQSRVEFGGGKGELLGLGELYLNDLSDLFTFELSNLQTRALKVSLRAELRKPFQNSQCGFQLDNENVSIMRRELDDQAGAAAQDEFNHVPFSVLRPSSKAALCAENVYLCEGYNELFNHIGTVNEMLLAPKETKRVVFSLCSKLAPQNNGNSVYAAAGDSSEEERAHLSETSCFVLSGRLILQPAFVDGSTSSRLPIPEMLVPLQGQVCRSLLRLDVKELHFDDCVPGGSFVKDFTVWNRSEIPLLFKLVSPITPWSENKELLVCTDYNSGYVIGDKTLQAAAYGHVRIRVTYRPTEIGERFFELQAQNLHDSRNVKSLRIHAITNQEHHREGLSIKEPNGSFLMSGSRLDFGDCYTGIASSKVILMRNMTEVALHVELTSDRPKEVTFELKLQQNRSRASRTPRAEEALSPTNSNDGSSIKGSLSPEGTKTPLSFSNMDAYGGDSDEEVDDNEADFYEEEFQQTKRGSFEDNPMGDGEDLDDDFEFDREPRPLSQSPLGSPKMRGRGNGDLRKKVFRTKGKKSAKVPSRVRDLAYDSGVDSPRSSPERASKVEARKRQLASLDENNASNFLVETIDLPPGVERTILIWYSPASNGNLEGLYGENSDSVDLKAARLTKQTFRVSFRCFLMQGSWQQAQSRVYDRTLGKSIHIRARTCTSMVTVTPSILHLGDCNIGELKSSSCMLTNHSELPTVVKPLVTSKVISTVPNDDMMLGPKQSTELKIEIIPRKTNPNYSRLISIINMKNKSNIPQICVRSSNMDAHHVIYHSLFYKLLTQSRSAFLNFDHVTINSVGIQVFDLENITNAPLHLNIQSSAPSKVRLYCIKHPFADAGSQTKMLGGNEGHEDENQNRLSSVSTSSQTSTGGTTPNNPSTPMSHHHRHVGRPVRRRRSFGSISELGEGKSNSKRVKSTVLRELLTKKLTALSVAQSSHQASHGSGGSGSSRTNSVSQQSEIDKPRQELPSTVTPESKGNPPPVATDDRRVVDGTSSAALLSPSTSTGGGYSEEVTALLELFAKSRSECDAFCHSSLPSKEKEEEIVALIRERTKRLQTLFAEKKLVLLNSNKERNIRIPPKSRQRIVAIFNPVSSDSVPTKDVSKTRVEKHKIMITLPPGGNKKAVTAEAKVDQNKPVWATSKHPFDTRPSVRELLLKSRVCRSVMNVNQKNINFGRIATSSKSSKRLVVQNMSATPLVYSVEKTGSISSGFLQIKEGEVGVVKAFGTKEICFQFQPTLAGPFEEKLKIINVQDTENSVSVTIKAKVVKRETFKLLQSGQTLAFGKCLVGEKTDEVKIAVRNTSRKKREYVIQVDPSFTLPNLRPTFFFSVDETPTATITQAQEKKLDEELEKLEHKLRIAVTKKKTDKIVKLNAKISQVKALLSGEQLPAEPGTPADSDAEAAGMSGGSSEVGEFDPYDSANSESELSESESSSRSRSRRRRSRHMEKAAVDTKAGPTLPSANTLHFSLGAEATGRIVAYAIFNPVKSGDSSPRASEDGSKSGAFQSQKMKKRQLRRDATPFIGVGKFLLFEQQNKDVVKELQYNAEIFLRTLAGENAFCRAVGRKPTSSSLLPPHPSISGTHPSVSEKSLDNRGKKSSNRDISGSKAASRYDDVLPSLSAPPEDDSAVVDRRHGLTIKIPDSTKYLRKLNVDVSPGQFGVSPINSNLLVPAEESPADTRGWLVMLSLGSPSYKGAATVEVAWNPAAAFRNILALTCEVVPRDFLIQDEGSPETTTSSLRTSLPFKVNLPPDRTVCLNLKWCFANDAGFAASTPLASCVSRSILESVSEASELAAGRIDFFYRPNKSSPEETSEEAAGSRPAISSLNVALVKAVQRSLCFEKDSIDLGEHQQGTDVRVEAIIYNRTHQAQQFLLLAGSRDQSNASASSTASPIVAGGDILFENATGAVEAGSFVTVAFVYKGSVPGQHNEQILLRNLSGDRLDTAVLTLSIRVTRPVYVRIPELDPQATGQLEFLDLGPCYVTPEMQDTAADSPNVSLRFSKVHKLTLHSQVEHAMVVCASSNLKTQCYVYEDARLHREATNVVLKGNQCTDLYVAIRPRLSSDAIKTGATRDLVGGIRVQLFGLLETSTTSDDEKSDMLAEFTVKFVGVAGASIARVTPSLIDFGVEYNGGRLQKCQTHEGHFELANLSKALPLGYRLFVTNATEGYSDDDESLHISLKHEKGEIAPSETGNIEFRLMAYTNGLFRRRIMVENIHYPGKISFVDVVLFVDSGILRCDLNGSAHTDLVQPGEGIDNSSTVPTIDFGLVNVIKLEDELADDVPPLVGENEASSRKYRIYGKYGSAYFLEAQATDDLVSSPNLQVENKVLVLTNTTDRTMMVRPLSTLPLAFQWRNEGSPITDKTIDSPEVDSELMALSTSAGVARRLRTAPLEIEPRNRQANIFYGDSFSLEANKSCSLWLRFASIAATVPLPTDTIESGKLYPLQGMVGIQSFDNVGDDDTEEACTLKVVNISGSYGESRFHIAEKCITLGKIGYAVGWRSSKFEIVVKNLSDVEVPFVIANLPAFIHVRNVRDAIRIRFNDSTRASAVSIPSLRSLALHAEKPLLNSDACHWGAWKLKPRTACTIEMELARTKEEEFLAAGAHEFPLRFLNLCNPHNHEDVVVRAQIISSYAELAVDPESSEYGTGMTGGPKETHVALMPPVTVPIPQDAPPHRASFWFSLRNVYDEELSVKLSSQTHSPFDRSLELLLMLRSANTPLSSIIIAPGESVDIRVVCHVFPSSRLPADTWSTGISGATSEILDLGRVWLDINIQNMADAAQREEIQVKGKLLPGKTFMLSSSSLHFFATATELPGDIAQDQLPPSLKPKTSVSRDTAQLLLPGSLQEPTSVVHQLRNSSESFWVRNPSSAQVLNFVISPAPMHQTGLCLIEGSTESDMCAMSEWIQAVAVPSSGTIAPGESVKITVHLEEAAMASPLNTTFYREGTDTSPTGKINALHKMRHHPTWRSNSWDANGPDASVNESGQNHMFLTVRDADSKVDAGVATEVDVLLVLQQQSSTSDSTKSGVVLDKTLITAAFEARNKRLAQSRKLYPGPALETHLEDESFEQLESSGLDNFEEFDISSLRSGAVGKKNHLPVLAIRGCTPAEYSSLENTRYLIDVGQHTVRNGGEVEWEITIESLYSAASVADPGLDSVEYRLLLVDKNARSWLQLSRERGNLDRAHSYQSVVLYFLRGVVGVYSTFMVLQNMANPSDLKVIHVRLEVIADLNSLRGMSSGLDPTSNLFRVLVSTHSNPKRSRRSSMEMPPEITQGGSQKLIIDFSEVYYYKLYQNHSIVIENSSGLSLDFILSTNARPQEVSFSISPMSFNDVTTVTLGAHSSMQVFLHFRPQPKQLVLSSPKGSDTMTGECEVNEPWVREIEVYVSCRLVKDFRETVILRAICSQPQLMVNVVNGEANESPLQREAYFSAQPTFLGLVFPMLESTLSNPELSTKAVEETQKFLVVRNTKSDSNARLALRNDSMFFSLVIDETLTEEDAVKVDLLDHGVCAGRRSTLLVTIQPLSVAIFRVKPDAAALWKHHQLWDHSVKEHVTLYNIKQFAEHYQVTLCFTCSNVASFYIPPNISESYPMSALEDIVAKFLQNYEYTWKWLISYHEKALMSRRHSSQSTPKLSEILNDLETALDLASPLSPRNLTHAAMQTFEEVETTPAVPSRDDLYQLVQSYRALYFDFYYITDELVWYGVRGNAVRHSLALADLAYGVVFNHEVFRTFVGDARASTDPMDVMSFPRLLLPWIRQLGHFLSFFPENQEATQPLRQVYEQLRKYET